MKMFSKLLNKTIFITGSSSGIGQHLAQMYVEQGANIILASRRIEKLNELKNQLVLQKISKEQQISVLEMDVTIPESIVDGFQKAFQQHNQIDILINNAGRYIRYILQMS